MHADGVPGLLDGRQAVDGPTDVDRHQVDVDLVDARLVQQPPGQLGVVGVDGGRGPVRRVALVQERTHRPAVALEADLDQLVDVQGIEEGLPDPDVVEGRVLGVEHQEEVVHPGAALHLEAVVAQLLDIGIGDVLGELGLGAVPRYRGDAGRGVHHGAPVHRAERGVAGAVVLLERLEGGVGPGVVGGLPVGPRADGEAAGGQVPGALGAEDMARHDLGDGQPGRGVREREAEVQLDDTFVDGPDLGEPAGEERAGEGVDLGVEDAFEGEQHIVDGHRLAVVPAGALAEGELPGGGGGIGGQRGGQRGVGGAGERVGVQQPLVDMVVGGHGERRSGLRRVPALVVSIADDGGEGVERRTASAAGADGGRRPGAGAEPRAERAGGPQGAGEPEEGSAIEGRNHGVSPAPRRSYVVRPRNLEAWWDRGQEPGHPMSYLRWQNVNRRSRSRGRPPARRDRGGRAQQRERLLWPAA